MQFKANKVIYRRYAGLYFSLCVDVTDNELAYLESIHLFVEILDHYFSNVCELDLVFNFHKVIFAVHLCVCLKPGQHPFGVSQLYTCCTSSRMQPVVVCCCQYNPSADFCLWSTYAASQKTYSLSLGRYILFWTSS